MLISRLALLASYALGCRLPSPLSASFVGSDALRTQEERHKVHQKRLPELRAQGAASELCQDARLSARAAPVELSTNVTTNQHLLTEPMLLHWRCLLAGHCTVAQLTSCEPCM